MDLLLTPPYGPAKGGSGKLPGPLPQAPALHVMLVPPASQQASARMSRSTGGSGRRRSASQAEASWLLGYPPARRSLPLSEAPARGSAGSARPTAAPLPGAGGTGAPPPEPQAPPAAQPSAHSAGGPACRLSGSCIVPAATGGGAAAGSPASAPPAEAPSAGGAVHRPSGGRLLSASASCGGTSGGPSALSAHSTPRWAWEAAPRQQQHPQQQRQRQPLQQQQQQQPPASPCAHASGASELSASPPLGSTPVPATVRLGAEGAADASHRTPLQLSCAHDEPRTPQKAPEAPAAAAASPPPSVPEQPDETPPKLANPWLPRRSSGGYGGGGLAGGEPGGSGVPTPQGRLGGSAGTLRARLQPRKEQPTVPLSRSHARKPRIGTHSRTGAACLEVRGEQLAPHAACPVTPPRPCSTGFGAVEASPAQGAAAPPLQETDFTVVSPRLGAAAARRSAEELPVPLRQQLHFIRCLPALPRSELGEGTRPFLPPQAPEAAPKPTLVLDLDETLVHCRRGPRTGGSLVPPDLVVRFDDPSATVGGVLFRPFVRFFLDAAAKAFELVVFTASQQVYADKVIDALDPTGAHITHRLYRQHCTELRGAFFKELSLLGRPLRHCILVDNSPISVACNPDQCVLIRSWYGDQGDQELVELLSVLQEIRGCGGGVDSYLSGRYGLQEFFRALREGEGPPPAAR